MITIIDLSRSNHHLYKQKVKVKNIIVPCTKEFFLLMNSVKNKPSYIRTDTSEIKESFFTYPRKQCVSET